jgi:hypothetical protein
MAPQKQSKPDQQTPALPSWENRRTNETCKIEKRLAKDFPTTEAYRFNSASIRIRIIDSRFEGMPIDEREDLVWPLLDMLPKQTRADISLLLLLAPSEIGVLNRHMLVNLEFNDPRPSRL